MVGKRVSVSLEDMGCKGAIISSDGWGSSDVDYMNTMMEVGNRNISIVGLKFISRKVTFAVTNEYSDFIVNINKSKSRTETEVICENNPDSRMPGKHWYC
ncbi:hypothetical protein BXP28_04685 [Paenibacillus larvae subsp. larvae]|nr:hypothetical protein BXP28_04685 [Paenibacillus larvae subsp. larvae]